jgi:hypothetical protein
MSDDLFQLIFSSGLVENRRPELDLTGEVVLLELGGGLTGHHLGQNLVDGFQLTDITFHSEVRGVLEIFVELILSAVKSTPHPFG